MRHITHRAPTVRYKSLAQLCKAIEQRSENYWVDTDTGKRVPNPNKQPKKPGKRSKKPKDSGNKPVPQSYNSEGSRPRQGDEPVRKTKLRRTGAHGEQFTQEAVQKLATLPREQYIRLQEAIRELNKAQLLRLLPLLGAMNDHVTMLSEPRHSRKSVEWAVLQLLDLRRSRAYDYAKDDAPDPGPEIGDAPERARNPKFVEFDQRLDFIESARAGDVAAGHALADMQEEGAEIPGADFNIRERIAQDGGAVRGAVSQLLHNIIDRAATKAKLNTNPMTGLEEGRMPKLSWTSPAQYQIGRSLEALGWVVDWQGAGAPEHVADDRVLPETERPARRAYPLYRPAGSVPMWKFSNGDLHTALEADESAYHKNDETYNQIIYGIGESDREYLPSNEVLGLLEKSAPGISPSEAWQAVLAMEESGLIKLIPITGYYRDVGTYTAPQAGHDRMDGVLWRGGQPMALVDRDDPATEIEIDARGSRGDG